MPQYVILNDDYLTDGYVDASYVGTDSDLYVQAGYIQDTVEGSASLSAQSSVTATATLVEFGSATISSSVSQTAVPSKILAGTATIGATATLSSSAGKTTSSTTSLSSNASTSTNAVKTAVSTASLSDAFDATLSANLTKRSTYLVSASSTLSSSAIKTADASATLNAGLQPQVEWQDSYTWDDPAFTTWNAGFTVSASKVVGSTLTYNFSTQSTLSAVGGVTRTVDITVDNFATLSADADRIARSGATLNSAVTADFDGDLVSGIIDFRMNSSSSLSAKGIFQVGGSSTLDSTATASINATKIARGTSTQNSQATLSGTPKRFRASTTTLDSTFTQSTFAVKSVNSGNTMSSVATQDTTPFYLFGPYQLQINVNTTFFCNGGRLRFGTGTFNALYATLGALSLYSIDPFRIYTVPTESRIGKVDQEIRLLAVKSEERVNTIEAETRAYNIKSETRNLKVQHLGLVDVFGPKDRRDG